MSGARTQELARTVAAPNLPPEASGPIQTVVIRPGRGWRVPDFRELWQYRELLYFLVWRDIKVRYKQTAFGAAWAIIPPIFTVVVFSIFFGRVAGMPSDGVPYPLFSLAALVPWTFFSNGLTKSTNSLVASQGLLKKIYFPRIMIPLSSVLGGLVDFAIAFCLLIIILLAYGVTPTLTVLILPFLLLVAFATALGAGLWFATLNVRYRDIGLAISFLPQLWLFASPIVYPSSLLSEPWRTLYGINPMAGVIEGFRWALLGTDTAPGAMLAVSAATATLFLVSGILFFRRMETTFADVV